MEKSIFTFLFFFLLSSSPSFAQNSFANFDLGGPCFKRGSWESQRFPKEPRKTNYRKLIKHHKYSVRQMCGNIHRWYSLVDAYLLHGKDAEALLVIEEMLDREFNITKDTIPTYNSQITEFLETSFFKQSKAYEFMQIRRDKMNKLKDKTKDTIKKNGLPENKIQNPACPGECCSFKEWLVTEDTILFDKIKGENKIGLAKKNEHVLGITGEIHTGPKAVVVINEEPDIDFINDITYDNKFTKDFKFKIGEILYIYDYLGEGYQNFLLRGKMVSAFIQPTQMCLFPSKKCWSLYVEKDEEQFEDIWWVKVKLSDGNIGWTDLSNNFTEKSGCM